MSNFLHKSSLSLAVVSLFCLAPFAFNNFVQGRVLLGIGALAIIAVLAFNAWTIVRHDRYYSMLTLLGFVPAILFFLSLSVRSQGIIGVLWCYPALLSFYCMLPERRAWVANVALLAVVLPQAWGVLEPSVALRMVATLAMVSVFSAIFVRVITEQHDTLRVQAITDPLTGLFNRTLLQGTLEQSAAQSRRSGLPMTLLTVDIDHFKAINDTYGHEAGDTVLRGIGTLLQSRTRRGDKAFRLGGEEFLILLYGTGARDAERLAETLRCAVAAQPLLPGRAVTVSIGVATLLPGEDQAQWVRRSDENLYRAKVGGRDRVAA